MTTAILSISTPSLQLIAMKSVVILWREKQIGNSSFVKMSEELQYLTDDAGIGQITLPICEDGERYQVRIRQAGDIVYAAKFYFTENAQLSVIQNNPVYRDPHIIVVTPNKVMVSDVSGKPSASAITADELSQLSAINFNIKNKLAGIDSIISGIGDDIDGIDSVLSGIDSSIDALDSAFAQLNDDYEQLNTHVSGIDSAISHINDTLSAYDSRLDAIESMTGGGFISSDTPNALKQGADHKLFVDSIDTSVFQQKESNKGLYPDSDKSLVSEYGKFKNWVIPSDLGLEKHYTDINIQYFPQKLILKNSANDTVGGVFLQYKHSYDVGRDTYYCYFNQNAVHIFTTNSGIVSYSDYTGLSLSQVDGLWEGRHSLAYVTNISFNQFLTANNPVLALAERCNVLQVKLSKLSDNQAQFDPVGAIYVPKQVDELWKGTFDNLPALKSAIPVGQAGWRAHVDPVGSNVSVALWDHTENDWVISGTASVVISNNQGNSATQGTDGGVYVYLGNYVQKDGIKVLSDFNFDAGSKAKVDSLGNYYATNQIWNWPTDGTFAQFLAQYVKNTYASGVKHHFVILDGQTFNEQFAIDSVDLRHMVIRTQTYSTACNVDCSGFDYKLSYRSFINVQNCIGGQIYGKFQDANPSAPLNVLSGKDVNGIRVNSPGISLNEGSNYLSLTGFKMQSWIENYSGDTSGNSVSISGCIDLRILNPKNNPSFNVVGYTSYNATHAITVSGGAASLTLGANVAFTVDSDTAVSVYQGSGLGQSVSISAKGELIVGTLTNGFTLSSSSRLTLLKIGSGEYNQFNESTIPAANKMPSVEIWHTDFNVKMRSNGTYWIPLSAFRVYSSEGTDQVTNSATNALLKAIPVPFKYLGDKGRIRIRWAVDQLGATGTNYFNVGINNAASMTGVTNFYSRSTTNGSLKGMGTKTLESHSRTKHYAAISNTPFDDVIGTSALQWTFDTTNMTYIIFSAAAPSTDSVTLQYASIEIMPMFSGA